MMTVASAVGATPRPVKGPAMRIWPSEAAINAGGAHTVQDESVRLILSKREVESTHHDVYRVTHRRDVAYHNHCPVGQAHRQQFGSVLPPGRLKADHASDIAYRQVTQSALSHVVHPR